MHSSHDSKMLILISAKQQHQKIKEREKKKYKHTNMKIFYYSETWLLYEILLLLVIFA